MSSNTTLGSKWNAPWRQQRLQQWRCCILLLLSLFLCCDPPPFVHAFQMARFSSCSQRTTSSRFDPFTPSPPATAAAQNAWWKHHSCTNGNTRRHSMAAQDPTNLDKLNDDDDHHHYQTNKKLSRQSNETTTIATSISSTASSSSSPTLSRRSALKFLGVAATTSTAATILSSTSFQNSVAWAGNAEVDRGSGFLFVPKNQMLGGGGSDVTRGIPLKGDSNGGGGGRRPLQPTQQLQNVYEPRFIAYLTRFLLNFDPAARGWWVENKLDDSTWDESADTTTTTSPTPNSAASTNNNNIDSNNNNNHAQERRSIKFAEFCESVEVGLADYFVGPYGSYSSVRAAMAGIYATNPAKSRQPTTQQNILTKWWRNAVHAWKSSDENHGSDTTTTTTTTTTKKKTSFTAMSNTDLGLAKQGILNLYALLKARYTSTTAKRQLAILFSLISSSELQPTAEIQALLGEADNVNITKLELIRPVLSMSEQMVSRTSSRQGGGYTIDQPPVIEIDPPPALGDDYHPAKATPIMQPTSRILKIKVTDPGEGYSQPPEVRVFGRGKRQCEACAVLDRQGRIEEIVVLNPGYGYSASSVLVKIDPPTPPQKDKKEAIVTDDQSTTSLLLSSTTAFLPPRRQGRTARATAIMEYEIVGLELTQGGNGYVSSEPPRVNIRLPPEDPDWFIAVQDSPEMRMMPLVVETAALLKKTQAKVTEMRSPDGNIAFSSERMPAPPRVDIALLERLQRDPLELLPSSLRPQLVPLYSSFSSVERLQYVIPSLPPVPLYTTAPTPRYRAYDPIFGGVGTVPVTKGALSLTASEYARLALSGALCTVIVRTVLNPLELIKTKQQLGNDLVLNEFCMQESSFTTPATLPSPSQPTPPYVVPGKPGSEPEGGEAVEEFKGPNGSGGRRIGTDINEVVLDSEREPALTTAAAATTTTVVVGVEEQPVVVSEETGSVMALPVGVKLGTMELIQSLVKLRGLGALFQSADITFLASLVFGSFGFGATELFRRSFTKAFFSEEGSGGVGQQEVVLLLAAALATVLTSAAATPFEMLRVRSMGLVESQPWTQVLKDFLMEYGVDLEKNNANSDDANGVPGEHQQGSNKFPWSALQDPTSLAPLWAGFAPTLSRELPFAVIKFLCFDILAKAMTTWINLNVVGEGALPVQVGVGTLGLAISAVAGALAGVAGATVSHPADLILTYTSAQQRRSSPGDASTTPTAMDWKGIVKDLVSRDGGVANLFVGLPVRATFFFLVIGLQFFLYDYVKNLFQVGQDDLSLVLDVFYAVRAGLVGIDSG